MNELSPSDPLLAPALDWFQSRGWTPFDFQTDAWRAYLAGKSGVVSAPTGTGKSYALWLGPILEYLAEGRSRSSAGPLRVLWITPLRALASDTVNSLITPIRELNLPWTVELRTGDTPNAMKARQRRQFPTALVTTPESISLLLSYPETREKLSGIKAVIVDEWHELLGSKRGVQTELALARLREWNPEMRIWGLSATLGNLKQARDVLLGSNSSEHGVIIRSALIKETDISTLLPQDIQRFPWAGHLGLKGAPQVVEALANVKTTLVFCNTRNQAENWFQALTLFVPEWESEIGLHHGSIDREERDRVERELAAGNLRAVVCTSSLDLGIDFAPVEQVIQIGSPKGIARLLQRAGRSGHSPGKPSRILCVPTNAFEIVEYAAAREAIRERHIEPRTPLVGSLDVLVQHLVTIALGGGFDEHELLQEVRSAYSFATLTDAAWKWCLDFVTNGGAALAAYPQYAKVSKNEEGRYVVESKDIARWHRLSIGTITSDSMIRVKYLTGGGSLGQVEESFIARLKPGDRFLFSGRLLELAIVKDMTAYVRRATGKRGTVPRWMGGRLPLSSELGAAVRLELAKVGDALQASGNLRDLSPELAAITPLMELQTRWSLIPRPNQLLVEQMKTREGHHVFVYPFEGRFVNEGLGALIAYRLSKDSPVSVNVSATDYGFELLSDKPLGITQESLRRLCSTENLLTDLVTCANAAEMSKRRFRDIARISGLVFSGYPGAHKQARQLQATSGLLWEVFVKYDPGNLLVDLAEREVLQGQLELTRLWETMERIISFDLLFSSPARLTPLSFPIWAERIHAQVSSESWTDRVQKMAVLLESEAAKPDRTPKRSSGSSELAAVPVGR